MELIRQVLFSALSLVVLLMEVEGAAAAEGRAVEKGAGGAALQVAQGLALLQEEMRREWKEALRKVELNVIKDTRSRLQRMEAKLRSLEGRVEALERRLPPVEQEEGQEAAERLEGRLTRLEARVQRALEGRSCTTPAPGASSAPAPRPSEASESQPPTASTRTTPAPGASSAPAPRPAEASEPQPSAASAPPPTADPARRRTLGEQLVGAAQEGRLEDARALLDAGADPNYTFGDGRTPLMEASFWQYASVASLLLQRGADVDATDSSGRTALHFAALNDRGGRCVAALVAAGARVDARNKGGRTALHVAAKWSNVAAARALVAAGASTTLRDDEGKTPLDVARRGPSAASCAPDLQSQIRGFRFHYFYNVSRS